MSYTNETKFYKVYNFDLIRQLSENMDAHYLTT